MERDDEVLVWLCKYMDYIGGVPQRQSPPLDVIAYAFDTTVESIRATLDSLERNGLITQSTPPLYR